MIFDLEEVSEVNEFFEHYGVKGMRWGVRKDEVLSTIGPKAKELSVKTNTKLKDISNKVEKGRTNRREKKAQEFDKKVEKVTKSIDYINSQSPKSDFAKRTQANQVKELSKEKKKLEESAEAKREGKLTPGQKKALKGAAIAGGIIAAYGMYNMAQSGELNRKILIGKEFLGVGGFKVDARLASKDMSPGMLNLFVAKNINPGYGLPGTKVNCRRCTFAYEMRRRGFDVAATRTTTGLGQTSGGLLNAITPDLEKPLPSGRLSLSGRIISEVAKGNDDFIGFMNSVSPAGGKNEIDLLSRSSSVRAIFDTLREQPDGSRGELGVVWGPGGGHSMAYEIVKGKPVIFDTQSGKMFSSGKEMSKLLKLQQGSIARAGFTRLDNIELNQDFLKRWLKDA